MTINLILSYFNFSFYRILFMQKLPKPPEDKSFDNRAELFKRKIYDTTKGKIRAAVVWRDLEEILASFPQGKVLNILDAGGGFGFMAKKLADLGHNVIVVDISEDMLNLGRDIIQKDPVKGNITFMKGEFIWQKKSRYMRNII